MKKIVNKKIINVLPFILSSFGALLSLALTLILTKALGKQQYGQIQYLLGIVNTFSAFSSFGLPNFLIRNSHQSDDKKTFFTKCLLLLLCINLIAAPVYFIISYFAFSLLNGNLLLISIIILTATSTSIILMLQYQYLAIGKKNASILISTIIVKLLLLIISTFLIILGLNSQLFQYYIYIYLVVYIIVLMPPLVKNFKYDALKFQKKEVISIIVFMLITLTSGINSQIAKIMLGEVGRGDYSVVAVYSLTLQIVSVVSSFTSLIVTIARPKLAEFCSSGNKNEILKLYSSTLRMTSRISIPFFVGFLLQHQSLLSIFGSDYGSYPFIIIITILTNLFIDISGPAGTLITMSGKEKEELIIDCIQFSLFLIVGFSTMNLFYYAIPLASLISYFVSYSLRIITIYKNQGFFAIDFRSLKEITAEILISIVAFYILNLIPNLYIKVGLDIVAGLGLILLFTLFPTQIEDTKYFLERT